jgi:hypothetical protein
MTNLLPKWEQPARRTVHDTRGSNGPRETRTAPPYPAEKARGGEIILRRPWQRIVFILGLALPVLLLVSIILPLIDLALATR